MLGDSLRHIAHIPPMRSSRAHRTIEALGADKRTSTLLGFEPGLTV